MQDARFKMNGKTFGVRDVCILHFAFRLEAFSATYLEAASR
jgi:hypothetical protein